MSENDIKIINHTITRLLASREHSLHELRRKLAQRGLDSKACDQQLALFVENQVQSDSRFAEMMVRSRSGKGQGEQRIRAELREHQIDGGVISSALSTSEVDWFELASQTRLKRFGESLPQDWKSRQQQQRFLAYRGFSTEQIRYACSGC